MSTTDRPTDEPQGDPDVAYAAALLDASGPVPVDAVDWEAFHGRLNARAELSLARLRHPHVTTTSPRRPTRSRESARRGSVAWWVPAARWSRLVVSASVAAGIALTMVVRTSPKDALDTVVATAAASTDPGDGTRAAFESAAIAHAPTWTIDSGVLPTAADLLIPLGRPGGSQ